MDKFIIWTDDIDLKDWKDCISEELMTEDDDRMAQYYDDYDSKLNEAWENYEKEHSELLDMTVKDYRQFKGSFEENWKKDNTIKLPTVDEYIEENYDRCWDHVAETNQRYLEDERMNLNIEVEGKIVAIDDRGLWYGRRAGYEITKSNNLNSCLYPRTNSTCDSEFWVEYNDRNELEFRSKDIHHDGTNYYTYRQINDEDIEKFEDMVINHNDKEAIEKYTSPLGQKIQEVYGFKLNPPVDSSSLIKKDSPDDEPIDLTEKENRGL